MRQTYLITASGGFFSDKYSEKAPLNALIDESNGFWYTPEGTLEAHPGTLISSPFLIGDVSFPYGDGFGVIGQGINDGKGNAAKYVGNAALFTTNNNISIFDPSLSDSTLLFPYDDIEKLVPYVAPWDESDSTYRVPVKLGVLAQVEPAVLTALPGSTGQLDGLYSVRLTYVRGFTGGESLSSPSSNTVESGVDKKIQIEFPLPTQTPYTDDSTIPWDTNDFWILYATPRNFANTTVFFKLMEVRERFLADETYSGGWTSAVLGSDTEITLTTELLTELFSASELAEWMIGKTVVTDGGDTMKIIDVTGTNKFIVIGFLGGSTSGTSLTLSAFPIGVTTDPRTMELDWSENDLTDIIPPVLNYPPNTTASFVIPLVNVVVLVGTDGGSGVAPSVQNFFEAYAPSHRLALPETPIGVSYKAEDAYAYILCKQSVHELRFTGATEGPAVALRKIASKGTSNQKSFTIVEGNIFSFTPDRNIIMIAPGGLANLEISQPIQKVIRDWNPDNVVMAYDERHNAVVAFHEREFISYHISLGVWSPPTDFGDFNNSLTPNTNIPQVGSNVLTAITYKGIIHLFTGVGRTVSTVGTTNTTQYLAGSTQFFPQDIGRTIILSFSDGTTYSTEITGLVLPFFDGVDLALLPVEFQDQVDVTGVVVLRESTDSSFALDRLEDGTLAENPVNARAEYQWNHFGNELLGKTVRMGLVVASNPTQPELPLNPTPVTILFQADGVGGTMSGAAFTEVTFKTDEIISNPIDLNVGIGRLIKTQVALSRAVRTQLHGVKVQFTTTRIPGQF